MTVFRSLGRQVGAKSMGNRQSEFGEDERNAEAAFAQRVLLAEARAVQSLSEGLGAGFHEAVTIVARCAEGEGTVLVTGLGKSGLIGSKISATLASLGITSHYVHPSEAAHGDLGRFRRSDVCIALSFSGETDEVVNLAAILHQDSIPIIAITRSGLPGVSSLQRLATVTLGLGPVREESEISPAPTLSTTASLAIGDALALCASRRLGFTDRDFARRHPGGALGGLLRPVIESLRFRVGTNLTPAPDDATLEQALRIAEANQRRPGALLLVARATGVLTGVLTDADLRRVILRDVGALRQPVADFMTRNPGTLNDTALLRDAVIMVREHRRDEIPVVDPAGRPVGVLDVQDLIAMRLVKE
ncbi:MAG: KpsF/GutQ family sugar-phosphate isomerase [Phycisphaerales bacterium]